MPTPSVTASAAAPQPAVVVISLLGITVEDDAGATVESATFDDEQAMLALVTELEGSEPTLTDLSGKGLTLYDWPGLRLGIQFNSSWLLSEQADLGGLPLRTEEGIGVGSSRADVAALNPFDYGADADGDGVSDGFGLDPQTVPDTESLSLPGQVGTAFIGVGLQGDTVTTLRSPSGDYLDI
ncbi:MAG: hypothetical protein ABJB03_01090 [Rhodoglobus sp.]